MHSELIDKNQKNYFYQKVEHLIWECKTKSALKPIIWTQVLPDKRQENCAGRYSKDLKNKNGEHLVSLCESNNLETQVIFPIVSQPELYFLLKIQITWKLKLTRHRVTGDGSI